MNYIDGVVETVTIESELCSSFKLRVSDDFLVKTEPETAFWVEEGGGKLVICPIQNEQGKNLINCLIGSLPTETESKDKNEKFLLDISCFLLQAKNAHNKIRIYTDSKEPTGTNPIPISKIEVL